MGGVFFKIVREDDSVESSAGFFHEILKRLTLMVTGSHEDPVLETHFQLKRRLDELLRDSLHDRLIAEGETVATKLALSDVAKVRSAGREKKNRVTVRFQLLHELRKIRLSEIHF